MPARDPCPLTNMDMQLDEWWQNRLTEIEDSSNGFGRDEQQDDDQEGDDQRQPDVEEEPEQQQKPEQQEEEVDPVNPEWGDPGQQGVWWNPLTGEYEDPTEP